MHTKHGTSVAGFTHAGDVAVPEQRLRGRASTVLLSRIVAEETALDHEVHVQIERGSGAVDVEGGGHAGVRGKERSAGARSDRRDTKNDRWSARGAKEEESFRGAEKV